MARLVSSKHLEGVSDLTLCAPIKEGFIDAFEAVTYETRLRLVLKALFKIRSTAREYSVIQPFVDTSARIRSLLDFRLTILDTEPRQLMLSATFDRPFEPYMRLIWDPLGPLLDVIFCNCDGYVTATEHGFPDYLAWVRKSQIDIGYLYTASCHSVDDVQYAIEIERLLREGGKSDDVLSITADDPRKAAQATRQAFPVESNRMGIEALVALYRLTDFYPPDDPKGDGRYLLWAAQHLLQDWNVGGVSGVARRAIADQLAWFTAPGRSEWEPCRERRLAFRPADIQGGIIDNYGKPGRQVRHGALLLMGITDARLARAFIGGLPIQSAEADDPLDQTYLNIAFTRPGLENIGVPASEIERFPQEFREGMEERAGLLGDVRECHPRRWKLPPRNWGSAPDAPAVEISEIDFVLQLRTTEECDHEYQVGDTGHPLHAKIVALANAPNSGVRLLSVEAMSRANLEKPRLDHFGLSDGISQPKATDDAPEGIDDGVPRGDILWGYPNSRTDRPPEASPILDNGTFLVVRKLSQDVSRFEKWVTEQCAGKGLSRAQLIGKVLGRQPDGTPLRPGGSTPGFNRFDFADDQKGESCPFQSHIRRANPRAAKHDTHNRPTPRILRRGMSYGPPVPRATDDSVGHEIGEAQRGVFFMAYNASIAEQYEVIQRWINGGNSTGVASWHTDPLMGVAQQGDERVFAFSNDGEVVRVKIPQPFVTLQWGVYLFVPSMAAIRTMVEKPESDRAAGKAAEVAQAARGEAMIARLRQLAQEGAEGRKAAAAGWKTCLEDFSSKDPGEKGDAGAVWAAIRLYHGGAVRVPYGISQHGEMPRDAILVASKDLVMRVFEDPDGRYSMSGQMDRMRKSFGPIFLGMDDSPEYQAKAKPINDAILAITELKAFEIARDTGRIWLGFLAKALENVFGTNFIELDLRRDYITHVLSAACNQWFGIPDGFQSGLPGMNPTDICDPINVDAMGWSWVPSGQRNPRCPGDYMATSRYCFYPDPQPRVQAYGQEQGKALRKGVRAHFEALRRDNRPPAAPLAQVLRQAFPSPKDDDELARTLIGVMTGFLPPVDGCLRWALYEWLEEKTLWRLQDALLAGGAPIDYARANLALREALERAMQKRPSPDMLWRTAKSKHRLGGVDIEEGDRIFVGIVSATAEDLAAGVVDTYPIFGGNRETAPTRPHACPAYKFAMGTMLGMMTALLEAGRIEALPAPLLVKLTNAPKPATPAGPPPSPPASVEREADPPPRTRQPATAAPASPEATPLPPLHAESSESAP